MILFYVTGEEALCLKQAVVSKSDYRFIIFNYIIMVSIILDQNYYVIRF